jgi:hypothetical protein
MASTEGTNEAFQMAVAPGARRLPINLKPAAHLAGSFLKEEFVDLDEHPIDRLLPFFCIECGDEFVLSPSGHQLCANRLCRDGFDVRHLTFENRNQK